MERLHGEDHLGRRAVGAGDNPLVIERGLGIDLGDHQRHVGVHSPKATFIDHDAIALDCPGAKLGGHGIGCAADRQVDFLECFWAQELDLVFFSLKGNRTAGGSLGSQERNLLIGKIAILQHLTD